MDSDRQIEIVRQSQIEKLRQIESDTDKVKTKSAQTDR